MFQDIPGFPTYRINERGEVLNITTSKLVRPSPVTGGAVRVALYWEGKQIHRSLARLVAEMFVPGYTHEFNTPIHLDGDKGNCQAYNLAWRPRWFAWHYNHQFTTMDHPSSKHAFGPVIDYHNMQPYQDIYTAGITHGLLWGDIYKSVKLGSGCFPTGQVFRTSM